MAYLPLKNQNEQHMQKGVKHIQQFTSLSKEKSHSCLQKLLTNCALVDLTSGITIWQTFIPTCNYLFHKYQWNPSIGIFISCYPGQLCPFVIISFYLGSVFSEALLHHDLTLQLWGSYYSHLVSQFQLLLLCSSPQQSSCWINIFAQ